MIDKYVHCFCGNGDFLIRENRDGSFSIICSGCEKDFEDYFKILCVDKDFIICRHCSEKMFLVKPVGYDKSTQWYYECSPCDYVLGY